MSNVLTDERPLIIFSIVEGDEDMIQELHSIYVHEEQGVLLNVLFPLDCIAVAVPFGTRQFSTKHVLAEELFELVELVEDAQVDVLQIELQKIEYLPVLITLKKVDRFLTVTFFIRTMEKKREVRKEAPLMTVENVFSFYEEKGFGILGGDMREDRCLV